MLTLEHQKLFKWLDEQVKDQQFGSSSLTVIIKNGVPIVESARLVKMKRKRYKMKP